MVVHALPWCHGPSGAVLRPAHLRLLRRPRSNNEDAVEQPLVPDAMPVLMGNTDWREFR